LLINGKTSQGKDDHQNHNIDMVIVTIRTLMTTGDSPIIEIVVNIEGVRITIGILDTENTHIIDAVITHPVILNGVDTPIRVIGVPGINGISTKDGTLKYKNKEDIIAKADI
jgi:hypothetical protein